MPCEEIIYLFFKTVLGLSWKVLFVVATKAQCLPRQFGHTWGRYPSYMYITKRPSSVTLSHVFWGDFAQ